MSSLTRLMQESTNWYNMDDTLDSVERVLERALTAEEREVFIRWFDNTIGEALDEGYKAGRLDAMPNAGYYCGSIH